MSVAALARRTTSPTPRSALLGTWTWLHRGAGGQIAKDNALSSLDLAASIAPYGNRMGDADLTKTSDGVFVLMHDDTVNRTTDGTGSVSSLTLAQVRALHLKNFPYYLGTYGTEQVPTFDEYLDKIRALRLIGTPEIKTNSFADGTAVVAQIVAKGLARQIIVGSFWPGSLRAAQSAGIKTYMPLSGNNIATVPDAATLLTSINGAPPDYVAFNASDSNVTDAYLSALIADGRVILGAYTYERRTDRDAVAARVAGLGGTLKFHTSDDPFYTGELVTRTTDRFATQQWEHGIIASSMSATGPRVISGKLALNWTGAQACLMGGFTPVAVPASIQARLTYDTLDVTSTRWVAISFGCTTDTSMHEEGASSNIEGTGYVALLRQNGIGQLFKRTNPTTSVAISSTFTSPALTAGATATLKVEFLAGGFIKMTRVDTGHTVTSTAADTTFRGRYWHFMRNGTSSTASIDQIVVTP